MKRLEHAIEALIFSSRWLLVPFYLGLVMTIGLLIVKFAKEFYTFAITVFTGSGTEVVVGVLTLIDVVLLSNLLLIIIFAGYENFVSKIDTAGHEDRPDWMGHVSFADLKMKLIGSIVAISGIELLKAFVEIDPATTNFNYIMWLIFIHLSFVVTGVLFAVGDWLSYSKKK